MNKVQYQLLKDIPGATKGTLFEAINHDPNKGFTPPNSWAPLFTYNDVQKTDWFKRVTWKVLPGDVYIIAGDIFIFNKDKKCILKKWSHFHENHAVAGIYSAWMFRDDRALGFVKRADIDWSQFTQYNLAYRKGLKDRFGWDDVDTIKHLAPGIVFQEGFWQVTTCLFASKEEFDRWWQHSYAINEPGIWPAKLNKDGFYDVNVTK